MPNRLETFIPVNSGKNSFDIYAIAIQEGKFKKTDNELSALTWLDLVAGHLGTIEYQLLCEVSMWEISLAVFVKKEHVKQITNIEVGDIFNYFLMRITKSLTSF